MTPRCSSTRRTLLAALFLALGIGLTPAPVYADHDWDGGGRGGYYEEGDRDRNRGGGECTDADGTCSDDDFSPRFDDSPVDRSFNPTICLPFSRCEPPRDEAPQDPPPADTMP